MSTIEHSPLITHREYEMSPDTLDEKDILDLEQSTHPYEAAMTELCKTLNRARLFKNGPITPEQDAMINAVVSVDARTLIATILPIEVLDELAIASNENSKTISDLPPPSLQDAYRLSEAYDATHDNAIRDSLEYILFTAEPPLTDFLKTAFEKSIENNTSIISEYLVIDAQNSGREDTGSIKQVK